MVLMHSFTVVITAHTDEEREGWMRVFVNHFSEAFGGATVVEGQGAWVDEDHRMIFEPNYQVTMFTQESPEQMYGRYHSLLDQYVFDADQEAVALIADGRMYLLYKDQFPTFLQ